MLDRVPSLSAVDTLLAVNAAGGTVLGVDVLLIGPDGTASPLEWTFDARRADADRDAALRAALAFVRRAQRHFGADPSLHFDVVTDLEARYSAGSGATSRA